MKEFEIYKALGDSIRLEMVKRLSDGQHLAIGELTKGLGVTRQGARKQLQVLIESGVVSKQPQGREIKVSLEVNTLCRARDFISKLEEKWDKHLKDLKNFVESE